MPLRLDLLRHGEAVAAGEGGDAARRLSDAGREAVAWVAAEFVRRGWRPTVLFSSPLRRAVETASILAGALGPGVVVDTLEQLEPERDPEEVVAALTARGVSGHVVLIGHQPLLGWLADHLAGRKERGVPTAGLLCFEFEGGVERGAAKPLWELRPGASSDGTGPR